MYLTVELLKFVISSRVTLPVETGSSPCCNTDKSALKLLAAPEAMPVVYIAAGIDMPSLLFCCFVTFSHVRQSRTRPIIPMVEITEHT